jgi:hypothetical protein
MIRRDIKAPAAAGPLALGGAMTGGAMTGVPRMRRFIAPLLLGASLLGLGITLGITKADAAIVLLDNTSGLTDTAYNGGNQTTWSVNTPAYNRINGRVFTTGDTAWLLDSVSLLLRRSTGPLNDMTWRVLYGRSGSAIRRPPAALHRPIKRASPASI